MSKCKYAKFSWDRVAVGTPEECWPWMGTIGIWGYGVCQLDGHGTNASRAAFITHNGPIKPSLVVCHSCDNPKCCNPGHLFAATQAENLRDCRAKGRQVYLRGAMHGRYTAKLTPVQVAEACELQSQGISLREIGRRWKIHGSSLSRAVRGKTWSHLKAA